MANRCSTRRRILLVLATHTALCGSTFAQGILHEVFGDSAGDRLGTVASVGDVDHDGCPDWIGGAPEDDVNGVDSGTGRVYSGRTAAVIWTFHGDSAGDTFAECCADAGDVDADGFPDLIFGADRDDKNGAWSGSAFVYSGRTGGLLYVVSGDAPADRLGVVVSGVADANTDGFDDFAATAPLDDDGGTNSGTLRFYSGKTGGILHTIAANGAFGSFGYAMSRAGDVDNDGAGDCIVGAPNQDLFGADSGSVYVVSGRTGALLHTFHGTAAFDHLGITVGGAGDVDGDNYDDLIAGAPFADGLLPDQGRAFVWSGKTGALLFALTGEDADDRLGSFVASATDADGDGLADIVTSASGDDHGGPGIATTRIHRGTTGGQLGIIAAKSSAQDGFGRAAGLGDLNGDGRAEIAVGCYGDDTAGLSSGSIAIYSAHCGAIATVGVGCSGGSSSPLIASVTGCPTPMGTIVLNIAGGSPNTPAWLLVGTTTTSTPWLAGCPRLIADPLVVVGPIPTPATGPLQLTVKIPVGAGAIDVAIQGVVAPAGTLSFATSNAVVFSTL